jgi:hypothetical protein
MQTSLFLAKLIGVPMLLAGIGVLLHQKHYRAMTLAFLKSAPLFYVISVIGVVAGLAVVLVHNVWVADWPVIITLLGWANLLRGAVSLVCPETMLRYGTRVSRNPNLMPFGGAFAVLIGATLIYFGYFAGRLI